jgi:hypothetical protein
LLGHTGTYGRSGVTLEAAICSITSEGSCKCPGLIELNASIPRADGQTKPFLWLWYWWRLWWWWRLWPHECTWFVLWLI